MRLEHWNEEKDGPLSDAAMRERLAALGYSVTRYAYPPGTFFPAHAHEVDKIDRVLSGHFEMEMDGAAVVLEAGDLLWVPRGAPHSARVLGSQSVVSLDAVRRRG